MNSYVGKAVAMIVADLTDSEVIALNIGLHTQRKPERVMGFSKIAHLYTENDGADMHQETKEALFTQLQVRIEQL